MDSLNLTMGHSTTIVNNTKIKRIFEKIGLRDHALISVIAGANTGEKYYLKERALIVGRLDRSDITLTDEGISRRHAMFYSQSGKVFLKDLGSANGI